MCDPTDRGINTTESHAHRLTKMSSALPTEPQSSISPTSLGSMTLPSGSSLDPTTCHLEDKKFWFQIRSMMLTVLKKKIFT
jgi:hypothetical protein